MAKKKTSRFKWREHLLYPTISAVAAGILVFFVTHSYDVKEINQLRDSNHSLETSNNSLEQSIQSLNETIVSQRDSIIGKDKEIGVLIKTLHNNGIYIHGNVTNSTLTKK